MWECVCAFDFVCVCVIRVLKKYILGILHTDLIYKIKKEIYRFFLIKKEQININLTIE